MNNSYICRLLIIHNNSSYLIFVNIIKSKVEVVKGMNFERYFRGEKTIKIFLAFIINNDSEEKNLILKNDIFSNEFDFEIIQEILPE